MPPRQPSLPEGTDHIVAGASGSSAATAEDGNGFVASAGGTPSRHRSAGEPGQGAGRPACARQAADRVRGFADDGKGRVTGLLENVSEVINDAAALGR